MRVLSFNLGELNTNTYFCFNEAGDCAVIDPGMDGAAVWEKLITKGLKPTHILLTHGHFDHAEGVKALRDLSGARVLVHRGDAEFLADPMKNAAAFYYRGETGDYPRVEADEILEDGDTVVCGALRFTVLHTPGHTPGSVCFRAGEDLFCGDTVFAYGFGRTDLYGGDARALAASLTRLLAIPENVKLYPGHGNSTHLDAQREKIGTYIRCLDTER